jgi:transcriptional antiterminator NusG
MKYNNWYAVQTAALCEKKVMNDILARKTILGDTYITDVEVPESTELVISETGKKNIKRNKILPGYVLVRVEHEVHEVHEENGITHSAFPTISHDIIMSTPNVLGFVGADRKVPTRMSSTEMKRLFSKVDTSHMEVKSNVLSDYNVGDTVDIIAGPFQGSSVIIDSIQSDKIITSIDICGRISKLELNVNQVYKKS